MARMRPNTTELAEMFLEEWGDSQERTTEWTPKYLQAVRMQTPARPPSVEVANPRSDLRLYAACGAAALVLGLLSSRALAPLIVGAEIALPKELLEENPALEPRVSPVAGPPTSTGAAKDASRGHHKARARRTVAKTPSQSHAPLTAEAKCLAVDEPGQAIDPNAPTDMNLMDAPSSPMELRALANTRARSGQLIDLQRQHDPLAQLDVMHDPAVALGSLRINSRPWSQVFIDNQLVGTTPLLNLSVRAGQHSVRLVNEEFGMRKTFDVSVRAGESVSQVVSLDD